MTASGTIKDGIISKNERVEIIFNTLIARLIKKPANSQPTIHQLFLVLSLSLSSGVHTYTYTLFLNTHTATFLVARWEAVD